jgi:hypothetical protein
MASELSRLEPTTPPPFSRIFIGEGDIEYTRLAEIQSTEANGQSTALIAILPRLARGKVRGSIFCTVMEG